MDNKKSKKKLFAIVGGSVLAFILTVVVSVAVTLAYFGGTQTTNATITMDEAVSIGSFNMTGTTSTEVLPGQKVDVKSTLTVETPADADGSENNGAAFIAIKAEIEDNTNANNASGAFATAPAGWVLKDGWYYYASADEKLTKVNAGDSVTLDFSYIVSTTLTNDVANETVTITLTGIAVQGQAFDSSGNAIEATITNTQAMFEQFRTA